MPGINSSYLKKSSTVELYKPFNWNPSSMPVKGINIGYRMDLELDFLSEMEPEWAKAGLQPELSWKTTVRDVRNLFGSPIQTISNTTWNEIFTTLEPSSSPSVP
jgi:hypothetical protein